MLEANRFIGRIDVRANRAADRLETRAWWLERGVQDSPARRQKIEKELQRLTRLAEVSDVAALPPLSDHPA
jgi:uncharacterized protein YcaQ